MQIGIWQVAIIAVVVVLLFGRGKISDLMGDVAKGINSFKKGLSEKDEDQEALENKPTEQVSTESEQKDKVS